MMVERRWKILIVLSIVLIMSIGGIETFNTSSVTIPGNSHYNVFPAYSGGTSNTTGTNTTTNTTSTSNQTTSQTNQTTNGTIVYGGVYSYLIGDIQENNQYPAYAGYPFNNTTAQPMPQKMIVVAIVPTGGGWVSVNINGTVVLQKTDFAGNRTAQSFSTSDTGKYNVLITVHSNSANETAITNLSLNFMTVTNYINYETKLHPNTGPNPYTGPVVGMLIILAFVFVFAWHRMLKPVDDTREEKKPLFKRRIN